MIENCRFVPGSGASLPIFREPYGLPFSDANNTPVFGKLQAWTTGFSAASVDLTAHRAATDQLLVNTTALNKRIRRDLTKTARAAGTGQNLPNHPWKQTKPYLWSKLTEDPLISSADTNMFIATSLRDPAQFAGRMDSDQGDVALSLNNFYSYTMFGISAAGSFCALVPNIFAGFQAIQDLFSDTRAFQAEIEDLLGDLRKYTLGTATVKQMLEALKQTVLHFIDEQIQALRDRIQGFVDDLNFIRQEFAGNTHAMSCKIAAERDKAQQYCSKNASDDLKSQASGTIEYAAGAFERMDLEEMQFLIMRFCEMMTNLSQMFFGKTAPLLQLQTAYSQSYNMLSTAGNPATAGAIRAGAIRFDHGENQALAAALAGGSPSMLTRSGGFVSGGTLHSADIVPPTGAEIAEVPTWEELDSGTHRWLKKTPGGMSDGPNGWYNEGIRERVMALRLAKKLNRQLSINCAWRSPETNARVGGAPNSMHLSGRALDLHGEGGDGFLEVCRSEGFTGFGHYPTFTHVDTGTPREWNG